MTVCKTPEEQAALDAMWSERHKLEGSLIDCLARVLESPKPDPTMGLHTEDQRVAYLRDIIQRHRKVLDKMFRAHERQFP